MGKIQELWEKQKREIASNASAHLAGETVHYVVLAQTRLPNWLAPIPFAALYGVKKCALVVTDRSVCVVQMPMLSPTKVSGIIEKHDISTGQVRRDGGAVCVGQTKIWPISNALMKAELDGALRAAAAQAQ